MIRLERQIFSRPPAELVLPDQPRAQHAANRIVHLGVGAFHRAHQALYTDKANDNWRITGASLRSDRVNMQLAPQHYLYSVVECENDKLGTVIDIVGDNEYFGWYYSAFLKRAFPVDEGVIRETVFKIMKDTRIKIVLANPLSFPKPALAQRKAMCPTRDRA